MRFTLLSLVFTLILGSCAVPSQQESEKYPRLPADNPERKSGPAMLFYEAAEEDADLMNKVIVIPPGETKKKVEP